MKYRGIDRNRRRERTKLRDGQSARKRDFEREI